MTSHWDEVSFVVASTYRTAVLDRLMSGPATPSMIADDAEITISHVSGTLSTLREPGLVELLVPENRHKGRVYGLTDDGAAVWETIESQQCHCARSWIDRERESIGASDVPPYKPPTRITGLSGSMRTILRWCSRCMCLTPNDNTSRRQQSQIQSSASATAGSIS